MKYIFVLLFILLAINGFSQGISFKDTINNYNKIRIKTDVSGAQILGAWGIANIAAGGVGIATAQGDTKYFFEMNAFFGAANTGVAYIMYYKAQKQAAQNSGFQRSYLNFRSDKRYYATKTLFDAGIIAIGAGLSSTTGATKEIKQQYSGFGNSLAVQGIGMLLFDEIMFISHNKNNLNWLRIMDELQITGQGLSYVHRF